MISNNNEIAQIEGKINSDCYEITVIYNNEKYIIKIFGSNNTIGEIKQIANTIGTAIKNKDASEIINNMIPKIYDANGNEIGNGRAILHENKPSYYYYQYDLNNVFLNCYRVGIGIAILLIVPIIIFVVVKGR